MSAPNFSAYEVDDDAVTQDLADFALANAIYVALVEGHAAEVRCIAYIAKTEFNLGPDFGPSKCHGKRLKKCR